MKKIKKNVKNKNKPTTNVSKKNQNKRMNLCLQPKKQEINVNNDKKETENHQ